MKCNEKYNEMIKFPTITSTFFLRKRNNIKNKLNLSTEKAKSFHLTKNLIDYNKEFFFSF